MKYTLKIMLQYFINTENRFTLTQLNEWISSFPCFKTKPYQTTTSGWACGVASVFFTDMAAWAVVAILHW